LLPPSPPFFCIPFFSVFLSIPDWGEKEREKERERERVRERERERERERDKERERERVRVRVNNKEVMENTHIAGCK
jgi:flagellar biosynthesis component FlhA